MPLSEEAKRELQAAPPDVIEEFCRAYIAIRNETPQFSAKGKIIITPRSRYEAQLIHLALQSLDVDYCANRLPPEPPEPPRVAAVRKTIDLVELFHFTDQEAEQIIQVIRQRVRASEERS